MLQRNMYIYRLGGDEFIILCLKSNKKQVESVIASIKEKMHETEYFCSIGYAIKEQGEDTLDSLFVASEEKMYEDKKEFYKNHPKYDRRNNS